MTDLNICYEKSRTLKCTIPYFLCIDVPANSGGGSSQKAVNFSFFQK